MKKYLIQKPSGFRYAWTPQLEKRPDMELVIEGATEEQPKEREEARVLTSVNQVGYEVTLKRALRKKKEEV